MKTSTVVALLVYTFSTICTASLYYQPNGVFAPISVSIPVIINQEEQPDKQPIPQQLQAISPSTTAATVLPSTPASTSYSLLNQLLVLWNNLFGPESAISSLLGLSKSHNRKSVAAPADQTNQTTDQVAELLTSLKPVVLKFFDGLTKTLENANLQNIANVLSKPLNELRNYLLQSWP